MKAYDLYEKLERYFNRSEDEIIFNSEIVVRINGYDVDIKDIDFGDAFRSEYREDEGPIRIRLND